MKPRNVKATRPGLSTVGIRAHDTALPMVLEQSDHAESENKGSAPQRFAYSIDEAAAGLGCSRSHFFNLLRRGEGPRIFRAGRRTMVSSSEMSAWISRMEALADAKSTGRGPRDDAAA